jgi:hypothetical protein
MSRACIEQLLYLMDEAFQDHPSHSLMKNLQSVHDDEWEWLAPDSARSILAVVQHVGANKYIYESQAFGDRSLTWERPFWPESSAPPYMIDWLRGGHEKLRASVAALADDDQLTKNRMAPWGTEANTRWIVNTMVQHDLYHAGEINRIRCVRQKNDQP